MRNNGFFLRRAFLFFFCRKDCHRYFLPKVEPCSNGTFGRSEGLLCSICLTFSILGNYIHVLYHFQLFPSPNGYKAVTWAVHTPRSKKIRLDEP
jgi:hypothetical protein